MHRPGRSVSGILASVHLALCVCGLAAAPSRADAAPAETAPQDAARAAYARGVQAYSSADYPHAVEEFSRAEREYSSPNIELMLGRSLAKLGRWREARRLLLLAQANATSPKYENTATLAAAELKTVEKQLVRVELQIDDPHGDEQLYVNGDLVAPSAWAEALLLDPGHVRIELTRPNVNPAIEELDLAAGSTAHITLQLVAPAPNTQHNLAQAPTPALAAPLAGVAAAPEDRSSWLRGVSYALAGVGVAGIAAFAIVGAYSHAHYTKLEELCPGEAVCDSRYRSLASDGRTYQSLANVALVAGGVALTGAIALWIVSLPAGRAELAVSARDVTLRGSF